MKKTLFRGIGTALITPMGKHGLDIPALKALVDHQIKSGIAALFPCGTTGEPSTLSDSEWELVVATVVKKANGRVPVVAGTGGNNTANVIEKAKLAHALGADAQLCVTPYYNKTSQEGLRAHYLTIADHSPLPLVMYNVPARTGLKLETKTVQALSSHENILALKEAGGDIAHVADVINACGDNLAIYSGSDEMIVPMLSLGALGAVSVMSNIAPRIMVDMADAFDAGQIAAAGALQVRLMPLIRLLFSQTSPIPVKSAAHMMGICENILRLPLVPLDRDLEDALKAELKKVGLL